MGRGLEADSGDADPLKLPNFTLRSLRSLSLLREDSEAGELVGKPRIIVLSESVGVVEGETCGDEAGELFAESDGESPADESEDTRRTIRLINESLVGLFAPLLTEPAVSGRKILDELRDPRRDLLSPPPAMTSANVASSGSMVG